MIPFSKKTNYYSSLLSLVVLIIMLTPKTICTQESNESYHKRMQWWDEGRLGMFLHWGVYSTFGGEYNGMDYGKEIGQSSAEWIYLASNMPQTAYQNAALNWNPNKYNPEEWVKMAKDAGMTYMVLTSKHHDGYALFNTETTDWNSVETSAINRDLIKDFVLACNKYDMKVGFYYSHEKDWINHVRQNVDLNPISEKYKNFVKQQITELFTNYGKIDLIWFDMPVQKHREFNKMCADLVRKLQPECIINGRIGSGLGDYKNIGDRAIVNPGMAGYMESIMTMRLNWGYDKNDDYWKSSDELIKMVSKSACRGSNFLLNIGPTPEGTFPLQDQVRLDNLGKWMKLNAEAIYKTKGSPFSKEHKWGSLSQSKKNNIIYLHLWNWSGGNITVNGLLSNVESASFLDTHKNLTFTQHKNSSELIVELPKINSSENLRIVKLVVDKKTFDITKGPDFVAPKVKHKEHLKLTGTIHKINGINFTITGRLVTRDKIGKEIYKDEITTQFTLNDQVRFRINTDGDIREVQSLNLNEGSKYHIVYSSDKNNPEVKIVTELK
ncbi:alpha-L-fucosidase [Lutibacter sp. A80]|uniref:alpha-L-fucosidase n=1 Tax=Lutibacter sp. A80 TaxID=2918453 RepID=UPI001F054D11|nr:alpha-L-fucosidase [Lutibacter sp. A80]UMB59133.1 alpha-L-fucosidase [Lutibacter sp. A80]